MDQRKAYPSRSGVNCDPSYPGSCIPSYPPDLDCAQVSDRNFVVVAPDLTASSGDHDGISPSDDQDERLMDGGMNRHEAV
jgi:hypothetical protein